MKVDNLYEHADEGLYCKLAEGVMKDPTTGDWGPSVIYTGPKMPGVMLTTTAERWADRFEQVAGYDGDDEEVLAMIRRCNPDPDFDMEDVWAGWHESESAISSELIELAICSAVATSVFADVNAINWVLKRDDPMDMGSTLSARITVKPQHLRHILVNYDISRKPGDGDYEIILTRKGS